MPGLKADRLPGCQAGRLSNYTVLEGWLVAMLRNYLVAAGAWRLHWLSYPWVTGAWVLVKLGLVQVVRSWALGEELWASVTWKALWKLHGAIYEEKRPNGASKYSIKLLTPLHLHCPYTYLATCKYSLAEPSMAKTTAQHLLIQTSPAPGRCNGLDLTGPQHWRGCKPGWCLSSMDSKVESRE